MGRKIPHPISCILYKFILFDGSSALWENMAETLFAENTPVFFAMGRSLGSRSFFLRR
jgi:hypothetical protein